MGNRYKTYPAMGIHGLQGLINSLPSDESIVDIIQEEGQTQQQGTQFTAPYKLADQYLVITEIEDPIVYAED